MADFDIDVLVLSEHEAFRRSFTEIEGLSEPDALRERWAELSDQLEVHASAEEAIFYPELLQDVDDVDGGLEPGHQADLWRTLKGLSDGGLTVVATCADSDELSEVAGPDTQGPIPLRQDAGDPAGPASAAGDPADSGTGTAAISFFV